MMENATAKRDARLSTPLGLVRARALITEAEYQAGARSKSAGWRRSCQQTRAPVCPGRFPVP
jgi:hypothetical protein